MRIRSLLVLPLLALAGCGSDPAPAQPPPKPPATPLERDINAVGAASAVGYDGDALKQDVQRTVDLQQQRNAEAARATEAAADP